MRRRTFITVFVMAVLAMLVALPMALAQSSGGQSGGTTVSGGASMSAKAATGPSASELHSPAPGDWPSWGRDVQNVRFSPLNQITGDNVSQLQLAWSRDLGITTAIEGGPVEYGGVLYMAAPNGVWALDATNGDLIWQYTTQINKNAGFPSGTSRGAPVLYNGKVYANIGDGRTIALDAKTGKEVWSTQVGDIKYGEGFSSEPIIADGKIVVGPSGADCCGTNGRIVALDPSSGKVLWTFNIVPKPGEAGFDTWQPASAAQYGGASAWSVGTYDPQTNILVWGTGQPDPWYAGDGIRRGDNLYSSSYVALDPDTGKLIWYRQTAPNDEWDQDEITIPTIADVMIDGQQEHVAILPTTTGFLNFADVKTGKLLKSYNMYKEQTGLMQTVHTGYTADGKAIINDAARMKAVGDTSEACPHRWASYEPASYDASTGIYFRPFSPVCVDLTMTLLPPDWQPGQSGIGDQSKFVPAPGLDYVSGMSAIDASTGKTLWKFTYPYNEKAGVVATNGGVVFVAAPDRVFRAVDVKTGDILWKATLPALMSSDPITYEVNGTQYVAVVSGGSGNGEYTQMPNVPKWVTGSGTIFVFALPKTASAQ